MSKRAESPFLALPSILAALQWVHDDVAALGGDPGNVTLFGQSAGASDVSTLLASPLAKGLVDRAISESGSVVRRPPSRAQLEQAGERLAAEPEAPAQGALPYLRSRPIAELLSLQDPGATPNVDGWLLTEAPVDAFSAGRQQRVPIIIGSNAIEFSGPAAPDELRTAIRSAYGDLAPKAVALYGVAAGESGSSDPVYGSAGDQGGTDTGLRCPGVLQAEWQSGAGNPTWQYQFDRAIAPKPTVVHSSELPYVFGNLSSQGSQAGRYEPADRRLSDAIQAYWTNFAKTGDPNGAGLPAWPKFEGESRDYLDFTRAGEVVVARNQRKPFCDVFAEALMRSPAPVAGLAYRLEPVAPGVYAAIASGVPYTVANAVVIVGDDDVVVVDPGAGRNEGAVLLSAIRTVSDRPIRWVIDTHFHFDHAFGNGAFPDAVVVGHEATRELLRPGEGRTLANNRAALAERIETTRAEAEKETGPEKKAELGQQAAALEAYQKELAGLVPVAPALTFGDRITLEAGGREIRLLHLGRAHTAGDVVVHLPRERLLCSGDLYNGYIGYMGDAYVADWADALDRLALLDFETVIPGHGAPFKGKQAVAPVQACLRDLWRQAASLKRAGVPPDEAGERIDLRQHASGFPRWRSAASTRSPRVASTRRSTSGPRARYMCPRSHRPGLGAEGRRIGCRDTLVNPAVLGNGTPGSVTAAAIQAALSAGGPIRLWTVDANEYAVLPSWGWIQEGPAGHVVP